MPTCHAVDAIVFDLGGVILDIDFDRVFATWAKQAGIDARQVRERYRQDAAYERHERGEITARQYFDSLRKSLGISLSDEQFEAGWIEMVRGEIPGVVPLIQQAALKLPLYVFSNTNAMHYARWGPAHTDLLRLFRRLFMSFEMGLRKPEALAFEYIAAEIGVRLPNILFFDDTPENVHAARSLGMQAVQVGSIDDMRVALSRL